MTQVMTQLNYNDITTLGAFQVSKTMTLDSSGVGVMPLITSSTNGLRFYGNTAHPTSADLFNINWNDKPSVGFTSQTHRFCFNYSRTSSYIHPGYLSGYVLYKSGSTPTPSSGSLYLVSDNVN
ncbi:hypothetical protein Plhal304r1_c092g0172301 [Plasmopara halstedii]